jgi:hypothetical protein
MSSIGFAPGPESEVEQLRSAYRSLNDVARNLGSVLKCIKGQDLRMAEHHLRAAEWHLGEAKRMIAAVGQTKSEGFARKGAKTQS